MIDLGTQLVRRGVALGMCYRVEAREFDLPARILSAARIEIPLGRIPRLRTPLFLLQTALRILRKGSDFRVWHLVVPQPMTAVAAILARILGRPVVVTVFAPYPKKGRKFADYFQALSERVVLGLAHVVAYECEATRKHFTEREGIVVLNGIDTNYYRPDHRTRSRLRAKLGAAPMDFIILYAGRIAKTKGIGDLLEAFREIRPIGPRIPRLVLVGPLEAEPTGSVVPDPSLSDRVHFVGPVGKDEVLDYYQAADAFVLPSYQEGISSSLVEAMACSLPAVVSNAGGNPEVVINEENGLVFATGRIDELRSALTRLMEDDEKCKEMAHKARERILDRFSINNMTDDYLQIYIQAAQGR